MMRKSAYPIKTLAYWPFRERFSAGPDPWAHRETELIESILKPSAKIAQGFDTYSFLTIDGKVLTGFVVSESAEAVQVRQNDGILKEIRIDDIEIRKKQEQSMMPNGLANNLTPEQLADLLAYLESLSSDN